MWPESVASLMMMLPLISNLSCLLVLQVSPVSFDESSSADALMSAIDQHPVSVAIEADQSALYSSGIHSEGCGTNWHHGVHNVCCDTAEDQHLVLNS